MRNDTGHPHDPRQRTTRAMNQIPKSALLLGLAGLLPFVFGAGLALSPEPSPPEGSFALIYPQDANAILAGYGIVILAFMSGVLWGFAAQGPRDEAPLGYGLSVLPALYAFFTASQHLFSAAPSNLDALPYLAIGFAGLLILDGIFYRKGLTPDWWMRLRLVLSAVVIVCLIIGYLA